MRPQVGASVHDDRCVQGRQEAPLGPVNEQRWAGGAAETPASLQLSSPLAGKQSLLGAQQGEVRKEKGELLCQVHCFPRSGLHRDGALEGTWHAGGLQY